MGLLEIEGFCGLGGLWVRVDLGLGLFDLVCAFDYGVEGCLTCFWWIVGTRHLGLGVLLGCFFVVVVFDFGLVWFWATMRVGVDWV